jgi:hypothetical protein
MTIKDKYLVVDHLNMVNTWGRDKLHFNEICVWRIELPCYPNVWEHYLTLQIELMVLIDRVGIIDSEFKEQFEV